MVDLGGSLAVASMGLYATGVSTDLNGKASLTRGGRYGRLRGAPMEKSMAEESVVTYLSSGGKMGDKIQATATCDKSKPKPTGISELSAELTHDLVGKTLAYTSVVFTNSQGELAARGSHTK